MANDIHIGELIRIRSKELRIGPTELGAKIETSKQNVYGIFKRKSIDTELLTKICRALDYDFFKDLSASLEGQVNGSMTNMSGFEGFGDESPEKREIEYLRRINTLLEENNAHLKRKITDSK